MGRKRHRHQVQARHVTHQSIASCKDNANEASILWLVSSEEQNVPGQPISSGCSGPSIDRASVDGRSECDDKKDASADLLVASIAARRVELRRSFDAGDINPILNDPAIFRFVGAAGIERIDVAPILEDRRNVLLIAGGGGILFCWHEPNCYEVHTNFIRPDRATLSHGLYVLKCSLAAYRWMFTRTDCTVLLTKIPKHNRAALRLAPVAGWVTEFERKSAWPSVDSGLVDMAFCAIRYDDWIRRTTDLALRGRQFSERLGDEIKRHGHGHEHIQDDAHDLHSGALVEMIIGGQFEKAVILYNRWARFAGYRQIELVSAIQRLINIGNALLQFQEDGSFKALLVR